MSKDELFEHIWPDQSVEEANLTQNISILRKALEGATYGKRYIATFHGHGYRFVEPVEVEECRYGLGIGEVPSEPAADLLERIAGSSASEVTQSQEHRHTPGPPPMRRHPIRTLAAWAALSIALLALLYLGWRGDFHPRAPHPLEITTLIRMEGAQYQPAWSPDGKTLAFISSLPNDKNSSVYIQASGDVRPRLLLSEIGQFSSPAWSPDGKSLAFIHSQQTSSEIVVFSLANSASRRLTTLFPHRYGLDYRRLDWSPDGRLLAVDDKANDSDPLSLYLVHISNGEKLRLTYPTMDIIGDLAPRFSPDGTRVAFIRVKYQFQNDVFVLPVTGGEARRVTGQSHLLADVDWQTNDTLIFSGRLDKEYRFWRRDLRNPTASATLVSALGTDLPLQFSISRPSGTIAFSAYGHDLNIWTLDLTRLPATSESWSPIIRTPGQDIEPSLSPDGSRMAFRSDTSGQIQLWTSSPDGTGAARLDTGGMTPSVYCWTPNSSALIFASISAPGLFEISLSPPRTLHRIRTDLPLSHPACSVDGKSVFAINSNFLYRVSLLNGASEKITDQGGAPIVPSKDGRYLYFAQGRMDSTICRFDLSTRQQTVIVSSLMPGYSDSWVLTSKGILFLKMESVPTIEFHDFATGKETPIADFNGDLPPVGLSGFFISPDERTLFAVRADPVPATIQAIEL